MSEAINPPVLSQGEGAYGSPSASEVLAIVERLAALLPSFFPSGLNLDELMTPEQCAAWMKIEVKTLNSMARRKIIPAILLSKNTLRYHPRSVLVKGHENNLGTIKASAPRRGRKRQPFSMLS